MKTSLNTLEISIILPTLNEAENLSILIPEIVYELESIGVNKYEILVIDDSSTDDTLHVIESLSKKHIKVCLKTRKGKKSLPLSIKDGINYSKFQMVAWLDADGSMPAKALSSLVKEAINDTTQVYIGSRFVKGGGYKGMTLGNKKVSSIIKNVYKSEDSLIAVFLSKIFNLFINKIINTGVKDVTSGFIVLDKKYLNNEIFYKASYGDYFILLLKNLKKQKVIFKEIGYVCLTRKYGISKSGTTAIQLIKRTIPYLKASFLS